MIHAVCTDVSLLCYIRDNVSIVLTSYSEELELSWNTYLLPQSRCLINEHHFTLQAVVWYAYILIIHIFKSSKSLCSAVHISCWIHLATTRFICPTGLHMMWLLSHWVTQDMSWILAASKQEWEKLLWSEFKERAKTSLWHYSHCKFGMSNWE